MGVGGKNFHHLFRYKSQKFKHEALKTFSELEVVQEVSTEGSIRPVEDGIDSRLGKHPRGEGEILVSFLGTHEDRVRDDVGWKLSTG